MKVSFVSSSAVSDAMRSSLLRMQADLVKGQKEVSTQRVADVGLALGGQTGRTVSLARDVERFETIKDANALVSERLKTSQNSLSQISELASTLLSTLTASSSGGTSPAALRKDAEGTLSALTSILNTSLNGEFIFAGVNTDVQPMTVYGAGSPAKTAFDAGFLAHFGFAATDPAAQNITAADMQSFMDTVVEPQFLGAGWQANWSSATDQSITSRIALNETAQTSVSGNTDGVRKLAMAATMITEILSGNVGQGGRDAMMTRAIALAGAAISDLADTSAQTGLVEQRVKAAGERLDMQIDIFKQGISDLEGIDPYEASTRVTALLDQIEVSYALTARIQQLSLVRYL